MQAAINKPGEYPSCIPCICLLNFSSYPLPFGTVPFRPGRPYCVRSKLLPASRRGPKCLCSQAWPAQCTTHHRATRPAPRTPLALCSVSLSSASWGRPRPCHPLHSCPWCQVGPGHDAAAAVSLPHSLTARPEENREKDQIAVSRSRLSDSRGLSPLIHTQQALLHNCHPPVHRSYATNPATVL